MNAARPARAFAVYYNPVPPCARRWATARWRLISHLNLNHLSLTGSSDSTEAFKEILRLYDFRETSVTRALIDSVLQVKAPPLAPLAIDGLPPPCAEGWK